MQWMLLVWLGCGGAEDPGPPPEGEATDVPVRVDCGPDLTPKMAQNGLQQWCEREDGAMHGPFLELYPDGTRQRRGRYDNNEADDEWIWWHANGLQAQTGRFSRGKKTGSWTTWYPNGKRSEAGDYLQHRKAGQWTTWYESGRRKEEGIYHNGKRTGTWTTYLDDVSNTVDKVERYVNDVLVEVNGVRVETPQAPAAPTP